MTMNVTRPCTTPDLQDQDYSVQDQVQGRFFWSQTGLVLKPTVSDHITGIDNDQHQIPSTKVPPEQIQTILTAYLTLLLPYNYSYQTNVHIYP